MNRPWFSFEGKLFPITAINWYENGKIAHVAFKMGEETEVAFEKAAFDVEGYNDAGNLHLDLEERVRQHV